jgi:hypothetical protein
VAHSADQYAQAADRRRVRPPWDRGAHRRVRGSPAAPAGRRQRRLITVLGGEPARQVLDGGEGGKAGYWPRVWAARGLLHEWDASATEAIIGATQDEAWRVREMAAKVVARQRVSDALDAVAALRTDNVDRVRAAATRTIATLTAAGA